MPSSSASASKAGNYEVGDVLVSADLDTPFWRKITRVDTSGSDVILQTRQAQLGEAVYKETLTKQPSGQSGSLLETRSQPLEPAEPSVKFDSSFYFDLKLDPQSGDSKTVFYGQARCQFKQECFPQAAPEEYRNVSCEIPFFSNGELVGDHKVCTFVTTADQGIWDAEGDSCDDIIAALDCAGRSSTPRVPSLQPPAPSASTYRSSAGPKRACAATGARDSPCPCCCFRFSFLPSAPKLG